MEKAGNVITKYIKISHIPIDESKKHGIHTLRHTLASRLLEHDVSLNDIAAILGHIDPNSSKTYMHLAIEKLRACALELGD
jgi:site-specific recombinase XerD